MASSATSRMVAPKEEKRTPALEAIEVSGESQYPAEHPDHGEQREDGAEREQQHPMARQSSLLSLTLDEIQTTLCEPGKNFGSMNMDEFLSNIWTAEEGTAMASGSDGRKGDADGGVGEANDPPGRGGGHDVGSYGGVPPSSLYRQGSVSLPPTLCRKTVDEVWSEIQQDQQQPQQHYHPPPPAPQGHMQPQQYQHSGNAARQPTFGEMTLEDFLIKAGVVRDDGYLCFSSPQRIDQFSLPTSPHPNQNLYGVAGYGPMMPMGYGDHQNPTGSTTGVYHNYSQQHRVRNDFGGGGVIYRGTDGGIGGRMGGGLVGVGSPVSPVSSDGFGGSQVDNSGGNAGRQWVSDVGAGSSVGGGSGAGGGGGECVGPGARKRILDGPVDKATERRQRRMIKNRESAARSRARKQAYTVELEMELNNLKEEQNRLLEEQGGPSVLAAKSYGEETADTSRGHGRAIAGQPAEERRGAEALQQLRLVMVAAFGTCRGCG